MISHATDRSSRKRIEFAEESYPLSLSNAARKPQSGIGKALSFFLLILSLAVPGQAASEEESGGRYAILVFGVSGDPELQKIYLEEAKKLHALLVGPLGFSRDRVLVLFDDPAMDPDLIRYQSTRQGLEEACLNLSKRMEKAELVFVFIDGHGSYDGKTYKLNTVGRLDPTAWELAAILYSVPAERFVVVNATSSSGGSLPALSGEGKIVITATKSGMERNLTHMGGYFVESLENKAADSNKDDRVSVLEAFIYASRKVEEYYKNQGNLQTEHSILDDNGDAEGQSDPGPESEEGFLARTTFFDGGFRQEALKSLTPEQRELELRARELERRIEALKYDKDEMPQSEYETKLEELLLELARINAKLRK